MFELGLSIAIAISVFIITEKDKKGSKLYKMLHKNTEK